MSFFSSSASSAFFEEEEPFFMPDDSDEAGDAELEPRGPVDKFLRQSARHPEFERFFAVEEAYGELPWIKTHLQRAKTQLRKLYDDLVLYKRLYMLEQEEGNPQQAEAKGNLLEEKVARFEATLEEWTHRFAERGILLRDVERGLVDFPYKSRRGEVFLLCWHQGEDGIFHFHEAESGFSSRKPITLLPE